MFRTLLSALLALLIVCAPSSRVDALDQAPPASAAPQIQAAAPRSTLPNDSDSVKFLVIGDSGTGDRPQYEVAEKIVEARERFKFEFVIMLGDNMYGGETAIDFVRKFETPYKPLLDDGVKFYASLGNHDDPNQRFYQKFNMDGKRYYTFEMECDDGSFAERSNVGVKLLPKPIALVLR